MPVFYFHHRSPRTMLRDDMGCSFASLDHAYLDAYRSMVEIGAALIKRQEDPSRDIIEIADGDGRVLMELHFSEVFRGRRGAQFLDAGVASQLREHLAQSRRLKQEMRDVCEMARMSVSRAHEMLARAKSTG